MILAPLTLPRLEQLATPRGNFWIVRDDLVEGGTKRRVIPLILEPEIAKGASEFVYASPAFGMAQVALAHACAALGVKATVFTAKRNVPHPRTKAAHDAGAKVVLVPTGYLTNVQSKARNYAQAVKAFLLPWGLDTPAMQAGISALAAQMSASYKFEPTEVWTVAGSGTLTRGLQAAWPAARFYAVRIGARDSDIGRAVEMLAPEPFAKDAGLPPPFPSCSNYDAKAWRFFSRMARPGALFWNVSA